MQDIFKSTCNSNCVHIDSPNVPLKVPFKREFEFEVIVMSQDKFEYCFPETVKPIVAFAAVSE